MFKTTLAYLALCCCAFAPCQSGPNADALKRLNFLIGNWTSAEKASRPGAADIEFTLHGKNEWSVGGTLLQIVESFEIPGAGKRHNLILMGYDAREKKYVAHWYTNSGPKPIAFTGDFDGGNFILASVPTPGSSAQELRITYKPKSATEIDATLEVKVGEKYEVRTVAKYVKGG